VIEAMSVVIQVFWFRTFHKRVFNMAPIHHHFELEAWSETKIMLRFWIVAAACGAIGFTVYQTATRTTTRGETSTAHVRKAEPSPPRAPAGRTGVALRRSPYGCSVRGTTVSAGTGARAACRRRSSTAS
jgi:hypothetical protein